MNDTLDENMLALVMHKTGIAKHTLWEKHISCNLYIVYDTKGYLPFLYASFMCYIDSFVISRSYSSKNISPSNIITPFQFLT